METSRMDIMYKTQLMGELKSILLATDGSPYSEGAINEAVLLAKSCGIRLTMLYVQGLNDAFETGGMTFVESMDKHILDYFDNVREKAAEENVELDIVIRRTSDAYKGIIDEAFERRSDIIIMGRRGMTGLKRIVMGSVTAKVLAYSPCKVLVVPKETEIRGENVMLATDGSKYSEAATTEAINMAKRCPQVKSLTVMSVATEKEKVSSVEKLLTEVTANAKSQGVTPKMVVKVGTPYERILETARENNINIILMGTHGRTGLEKLLMGSVAERVVALSPCSVLVIKQSMS
ncbi:MAG: universal stress protein [Candidatus Magnetoovum sp. WYHC-5]|nr:universal stress protein [Candidatus Magnetoovum sp. WYHC-5]